MPSPRVGASPSPRHSPPWRSSGCPSRPCHGVADTGDLSRGARGRRVLACGSSRVATATAPRRTHACTASRRSSCAAALLGAATFSKPPNVLLIVPPIVAAWRARQWMRGLLIGVVFGASVAGLFAANAAITGEFNYQGGDRRTLRPLPVRSRRRQVRVARLVDDDQRGRGGRSARPRRAVANALAQRALLPHRPAHRLPAVLSFRASSCSGCGPRRGGVAALAVDAGGRTRRVRARAARDSALQLGRRRRATRKPLLLSLYPTLFVLLPPLRSALAPALTIAASGLFVAHILVNPFVAAKSPWLNVQRGLLRRLRIELTMVNDLPVMLDPGRARSPSGEPSAAVFPRRPRVASRRRGHLGRGARTEIIARTDLEVDRFSFQVQSIVPNDVGVSAGGRSARARLAPGTPATLVIPARGSAPRRFRVRPANLRVRRGSPRARRRQLARPALPRRPSPRHRAGPLNGRPVSRIAVVTSHPPFSEGGHLVVARGWSRRSGARGTTPTWCRHRRTASAARARPISPRGSPMWSRVRRSESTR